MTPKVIKTESEYDAALSRIEELLNARAGTPEGDELDLLATLVSVYEEAHHPVDLPDPLEAIKFRMDSDGLCPQDLVPYLGTRSRVSEVLSGARPLNLRMVRALHSGLGIPAESLIREPDSSPAFSDWD